jgi:hypothetical protein
MSSPKIAAGVPTTASPLIDQLLAIGYSRCYSPLKNLIDR